jgi:hypothetical protein
MSVFLQPIYSQTVGSGGAASITFNNIPQTFTDLKLVMSTRTTLTTPNVYDILNISVNGGGTKLSYTGVYGTGTATASERIATGLVLNWQGYVAANGATASTFSNSDFYIPNYTGSNFKSFVWDQVVENNATANIMELGATLWQSTSAITSLSFSSANAANLLQYSTFTLYGITRG